MPIWENEDQDGKPRGNQPTPKQKLMTWINSKLPPDMQIQNFTTDWNDGRTIGALVDSCAPGLYPDWSNDDPRNRLANAKDAMDLAEQWLGVPQVYTFHFYLFLSFFRIFQFFLKIYLLRHKIIRRKNLIL